MSRYEIVGVERSSQHLNYFSQMSTNLIITLCRYYAIAAPLHYAALVSPRRVVVGLAASWTGALLLCLPPFSGLVPPYRFVYTINHRTDGPTVPLRGICSHVLRYCPAIAAFPRIMKRDSIYSVFRALSSSKLFRVA